MAEYAPGDLPQFEKALGSKLGVSTIPLSGHGPLSSKIAADSLDDWVIPKGAKNPALAWEFIKLVSDKSAGQRYAKLLGTPPANIAADASITDPLLKYMANKVKDPGIPLLDSVLSNAVALYLYRELQLAFAGQTSPQAAMQATQADAQHHGP
jgi:ABC-type glycerol-3-phosphate transport system substrate-binding protein